MFLKKYVVKSTDPISAIGNEYHTPLSPIVCPSIYAAGNNINICLVKDIIRLAMPFPRAWNTEPTIMQNPANAK